MSSEPHRIYIEEHKSTPIEANPNGEQTIVGQYIKNESREHSLSRSYILASIPEDSSGDGLKSFDTFYDQHRIAINISSAEISDFELTIIYDFFRNQLTLIAKNNFLETMK